MPYVKNDVCDTPSRNTSIWRYMDFMKFVNLIAEKKLYLCNPENMDDPFEGKLPENYKRFFVNKQGDPCEATIKTIERLSKLIGRCYFINCWHMNEYESDAMWKIYALNDEGIAIRATIGNLIDSIEECKLDIHIGKVDYINHNTYSPMNFNPERFNPIKLYMLKNISYEHEKEIRVLCATKSEDERILVDNGIKVPVNIETLIEKVYLSPIAPDWIFRTVKSIMDTYKVNKPLVRSKLS